ncbi:TRAP transporter permease [Cytobacillus purgationiresistens]|uniref:TRAP transporter 4TM/12TM fusion protein n=1 Tax=Cytobacillus purgationiresistens TaxID=863449 RepID=A0ABU0AEJ3_9BACI|nr:TRAP transporter fused permease subunit [Cytobacillus purgationiresistens]MDQ0269672.1 TRAP transporter 4TM/12TM fusion protein [Cytobacillus purgationiresistens]
MKTGRLNSFWKIVIVISTAIGIFLSVNMLFYLELFGINPIQNAYLIFLLSCFLPIAFIIFPAKKTHLSVKWYDILFFAITMIITFYIGLNGERIITEGWDWTAPIIPTIFSILLWALLLEALRRTGGLVLSAICLVISLYPLIASNIPIGFLQGQSYDFLTLARNHIMSSNSVFGIAYTTIGNLLLGFLVFGVVITRTGGGDFFFNLALSLFGRTRGGSAKVAVVGSAFFGMLSGSAVSNAVTIGAMTIPAMKKTGYKPHYAAAIEATASTGGTITPPIMGSAAFIMASFIGVPYYQIALAAAVPAFLYYWGLYIQIDGYAAKNKLKGMPKSEIPSFWKTLKEGWYYIFAILIMIFFLAVLNSEGQAPYYASAVLLIIAMIKKQTRMNKQQFLDMFVEMGKVLTDIVVIIAGVGFIVGALSATGVSFSFSRELVAAAGDNTFLILIGGALTCFILGMGMTVSAVYVFLAIIMAPALVAVGVDPIAAHLYVVYWATVSYITPPVALAAFATASIAGASPMKTAFQSVQLGSVKFIIPFFMIYNPAILIGRGDPMDTVISIILAIIGISVIAFALEGYLLGAGELKAVERIFLFILGLFMFVPLWYFPVTGIVLSFIFFFYKKKASNTFIDSDKGQEV